MTRVAVLGAAGRMGSTVCDAVAADAELELVARIDVDDSLDAAVENRAEVAVDFTTPDSVKANVLWLLEHGVHCVVGTTGLSDDDLAEIGQHAQRSPANCFVAPNFAVGAVLMMHFAAQAAPYFGRAEISERHHEHKLDAPSGTSLRTAELMNRSRGSKWDEVDTSEPSRGLDVGGINVHSLRVPGSVAHQEVILGSPGQTLTIKHDSLDRASFMPGVILAVKNVASLPGLTVGLEHLLDL
ncbi:MAG: 4-hydroxy-tetrahydrodipicolinate reductase [Actinomycetota bacterium]|nr:4-hydroxy-tetrahydrodipicolinate reductase [Actinomycetota bacterium]